MTDSPETLVKLLLGEAASASISGAKTIRVDRVAYAKMCRAAADEILRANRAALLDRAPSGVGEWQPIEMEPKDGTPVLVFFANRVWSDEAGEVASFGLLRDYVEHVEVAFFDGGDWCQAGTGHDYFEGFRYEDELPTHWAPLPGPPALARLSAEESPDPQHKENEQ